jgi:4'-phosphopantetheinyl transferase
MSLDPTWQAAPRPLALNTNEVHVWRAGLDADAAAVERWRQTLSNDELARAGKFHSAVQRDHYTAGRGMLRSLLARYLGAPAGEFQFRLNAHGKPALDSGSQVADLRFNLSHSHGMALFAFSLGGDVGVDGEYVRPSRREMDLAKRFFSPQEVAVLRAFPESSQREMFYHCWTRKEAYIKARGAGLSINLASFTVSLAADTLAHLPITGHADPEAGRWWLRTLAPGEDYVGAVAAEGAEWALTLFQYEVEWK